MLHYYNSICFSVILFALMSCKKDEDHGGHSSMCTGPRHKAYITSPDLLKCKFKTGTYWIYYDSVTTAVESLHVQSYTQDFLFDGCVTSFQYHSYNAWSSAFSKAHSYVVVQGGLFKGFTGFANSGIKIYPDTYGIRYDSIFIFNQYYKNVSEVTVASDPTESNNKSIYYTNSDYGPLKQEIYANNILINQRVLISKSINR